MQHRDLPQSLSDFLEGSTVAISLARAEHDHALVFVNSRFVELTGYGADDIVGHNCRLMQRDVKDGQAHAKIRAFLEDEDAASVRAPIVNFRKDETPFVNLVSLSRLRASTGEVHYILGSQFDVSRTLPERLQAYDRELAQSLIELGPLAADSGLVVDRTLTAIADAVSTIAQAQLALAEAGGSSLLHGWKKPR